MELKEQRYVCTLAEYGNLTRAADRLYISQPALSIYICTCQQKLDTKLKKSGIKNESMYKIHQLF